MFARNGSLIMARGSIPLAGTQGPAPTEQGGNTVTTPQPMITAQDLYAPIQATAQRYADRLDAVRARIEDFTQECARRHATDAFHDTSSALRDIARWIAGDFDQSYASFLHGTREEFRAKYAASNLDRALHYLAWAEHYAGLRSLESARDLDPWR